MTQQEQWRPIPGFDGYEISDLGRAMSYRRPQPRLLKIRLNSGGYPHVGMYCNAKLHFWPVHRAVTQAFLGSRPEGMEVRHLDGNKLNSALANLAYGTRSENQQDSLRHGTHHLASKTHCLRGHAFDADNTYQYKNHRQCRACKRQWESDRNLAAANVSGVAA